MQALFKPPHPHDSSIHTISIKIIVDANIFYAYTHGRGKYFMKKYQKILIIFGIIVPVILIAGFIFIYTWEGSPKKIVAVADQFQAPTSWQLVSENIRGPRISCWDGGGCPYVHRVWEYDALTYNQLEELLRRTDWRYSSDDRCKTMGTNDESQLSSVCVIELSADNFEGSIYINNGDDQQVTSDPKYTLSLTLDPR
jgi:hypothetical protein